MSYNGSGTFVVNSSGQPVVTGTVISSTAFNALTADLATGLSTAITKDGQTTTTARIVFAQGVSSTLVTDATSATTGSIITAGGISAQKALWVGTTTTLAGALTYGGVTLSNAVTGTGNMVLSASPTLTGTLTAAAANFSGAIGANATGGASITANGTTTTSNNWRITNTSGFMLLEVAGSAGGNFSGAANYSTALGTFTATSLHLATNGAVRATLDTSGNLGIGMTPSNILDITQNQNSVSYISLLNANAGASAGTRFIMGNSAGGGRAQLMQFGGGYTTSGIFRQDGTMLQGNGAGGLTLVSDTQPIYFAIGGTEVARIDTSGNLLVGTTGNASTSRAVFRNTQNVLALDNTGGQYTTMTFCNNNTAAAYVFYDNTNSRLYVQTGGSGGVYLAATGTSWTAVSDERVKDIIEPIENATDKLAGWRTVIGKYKTDKDGVRRSFLIAQDILKTFPEAVDATNIDEYGVNYQDTIPVLVAAIQELTTRLAALENK